MKQTSETAVKQRRNLLSALGMGMLGLCASSQFAMAGEKEKSKCEIPTVNSEKDNDFQLAKIVGALCLSQKLRDAFFGAPDVGAAKKNLGDQLYGPGTKKQVTCAVEKIYASKIPMVKKKSKNPPPSGGKTAQAAATTLSDALQTCGAVPCPDWPC